jgi:indolepyruvate decarboxylase
VLFNNRSWEMLRVFQPESRFNDLDDWHFSDIAASIGGVGERVTTRSPLRSIALSSGAGSFRWSK